MSRQSRVRRQRDCGQATAELAVSLPTVVILLLAGITGVNAAATRLGCLDAARDAALALARGDAAPPRPPGASVTVERDGDLVRVRVSAPVAVLGPNLPAMTVSATAVAAFEPGAQP